MEPRSGRLGSSHEEGFPFLNGPQGCASCRIPDSPASPTKIRSGTRSPTRPRPAGPRHEGRSLLLPPSEGLVESCGPGRCGSPPLRVRPTFPWRNASPGPDRHPEDRRVAASGDADRSGGRLRHRPPPVPGDRSQRPPGESSLAAASDARRPRTGGDSPGTSPDPADVARRRYHRSGGLGGRGPCGAPPVECRWWHGVAGRMRSPDAAPRVGGSGWNPGGARIGNRMATAILGRSRFDPRRGATTDRSAVPLPRGSPSGRGPCGGDRSVGSTGRLGVPVHLGTGVPA